MTNGGKKVFIPNKVSIEQRPELTTKFFLMKKLKC